MEAAAQAPATPPVEDASAEPNPATDGVEITGQSGSAFGQSEPEPTPSGEPEAAPADVGSDPLSKFKDNEGNFDVENLGKSFVELQSKLGQKKEKLLEEAREEERVRLGNVPASPEEYKIPENLVEGYDVEIPQDDALLSFFREYAHKTNMPQAAFEDGLKSYMSMQAESLPDLVSVVKELGEGAQERIRATDTWLNANMPKDLYPHIAEHANTPGYIKAMEWLVNQVREPNFSAEQGQVTPTRLTIEELRSMQDDPKYWRDKDPQFIRRVEDGYKRLFDN